MPISLSPIGRAFDTEHKEVEPQGMVAAIQNQTAI